MTGYRRPWQWVALGVIVTVLVLGISGNLVSCAPVDRTLNPDARNWWESEEAYILKFAESCAAFYTSDGATQRCIDGSVREAIDRGYLSDEWVR